MQPLWAAYHPPDLVTGLNISSRTASMQFVLYFPYGPSAVHAGASNVPVSTVRDRLPPSTDNKQLDQAQILGLSAVNVYSHDRLAYRCLTYHPRIVIPNLGCSMVWYGSFDGRLLLVFEMFEITGRF
ncbi:hypothetical protein PILCRDRAFT_825562 [Piloderma croceum F 1598]|uniref:Uncharacterized protein n=1 Tax=Piloderma croceum (strain F 1598) TaxID=765440 RepID=A0A0C3ATH1_PILCF|nr:hypothetical protein PILCRDRAFT_825562 [Piloderma croceum F 1598]